MAQSCGPSSCARLLNGEKSESRIRPVGFGSAGVGPVRQLAFPDPSEDGVELVLGDEERVVLSVEGLVAGRDDVEADAVYGTNWREGTA